MKIKRKLSEVTLLGTQDQITFFDLLSGGEAVITLTAEEIETIYRYQERQYRLQDAKNHLLEYLYGDMNYEPDDNEKQEFLMNYHVSFDDAISLESEKEILTSFADKFEEVFDCNSDENALWSYAIVSVLCEMRGERCA